MTVEIRKLESAYLDQATATLKRAVSRMIQNKILQWDELYPTKEILSDDIASGVAFGLFCDEALAGYVVLNERQDSEYAAIPWRFIEGKQLVIHRLFIDPAFQGKGLAQAMLAFAEEFGTKSGYASIRLDAFPPNEAAIHMYEKRGFLLRGTVRFRKGIFNCYEKLLPVNE